MYGLCSPAGCRYRCRTGTVLLRAAVLHAAATSTSTALAAVQPPTRADSETACQSSRPLLRWPVACVVTRWCARWLRLCACAFLSREAGRGAPSNANKWHRPFNSRGRVRSYCAHCDWPCLKLIRRQANPPPRSWIPPLHVLSRSMCSKHPHKAANGHSNSHSNTAPRQARRQARRKARQAHHDKNGSAGSTPHVFHTHLILLHIYQSGAVARAYWIQTPCCARARAHSLLAACQTATHTYTQGPSIR